MSGLTRRTALGACGLLLSAAAEAPPTDPARRWRDGQAAHLAWNRRRPGWRATASGLQYRRLGRAAPSAPHPTSSDRVQVRYELRLINGDLVRSSFPPADPSWINLGRAIPGWREALPMMRVGETWTFLLPSALAYGPRRFLTIPEDSALAFRVLLLAIAPPP